MNDQQFDLAQLKQLLAADVLEASSATPSADSLVSGTAAKVAAGATAAAAGGGLLAYWSNLGTAGQLGVGALALSSAGLVGYAAHEMLTHEPAPRVAGPSNPGPSTSGAPGAPSSSTTPTPRSTTAGTPSTSPSSIPVLPPGTTLPGVDPYGGGRPYGGGSTQQGTGGSGLPTSGGTLPGASSTPGTTAPSETSVPTDGSSTSVALPPPSSSTSTPSTTTSSSSSTSTSPATSTSTSTAPVVAPAQPVVTVTDNGDGTWTVSARLGAAGDPAGYKQLLWTVDGKSQATHVCHTDCVSGQTVTVGTTSALPAGAHLVNVTAVNATGLSSPAGAATITIASVPAPQPVTGPSANGDYTVALPAGSTVDVVEYHTSHDEAWHKAHPVPGTDRWTFTVHAGSTNVLVRSVRNGVTSAEVALPGPPTASASRAPDGTWSVLATLAEHGSQTGYSHLDWTVDPSGKSGSYDCTAGCPLGTPVVVASGLTLPPGSAQTISVTAVTHDGGEGTSRPFPLAVPAEAPLLRASTTPNADGSYRLAVTVESVGDVTPLRTLTWSVDGATNHTHDCSARCVVGREIVLAAAVSLLPGTHTLRASATNGSGKTGSATATVDVPTPAVTDLLFGRNESYGGCHDATVCRLLDVTIDSVPASLEGVVAEVRCYQKGSAVPFNLRSQSFALSRHASGRATIGTQCLVPSDQGRAYKVELTFPGWPTISSPDWITPH